MPVAFAIPFISLLKVHNVKLAMIFLKLLLLFTSGMALEVFEPFWASRHQLV